MLSFFLSELFHAAPTLLLNTLDAVHLDNRHVSVVYNDKTRKLVEQTLTQMVPELEVDEWVAMEKGEHSILEQVKCLGCVSGLEEAMLR